MKKNVLKLALLGIAIGSFVGGCACGSSNGDNYQNDNKQNNQNQPKGNTPCSGGSSGKSS